MRRKNFLTLLPLFALFMFLSIDNEPVEAEVNIFGCKPTEARLDQINTTAKLKAYLDEIDVAYTKYVSKAGKTLTINKSLLQKYCIVVYGTPGDVKNSGKKVQVKDSSGQYKYLGYSSTGSQYLNPNYIDISPAYNYIKVRDFVKNPWNNSALKNSINNSPIKPAVVAKGKVKPTYTNPKTGVKLTAAQELNRAIDRNYLTYCEKQAGNCDLGGRGFFPSTNNFSGTTMTGGNLINYASVNEFPGKFTPGYFNLYTASTVTPGLYFYSTNYMPPHYLPLNEERDLSVSITSISPSSVAEKETYTVKYKVCNNGDFKVKNPVITYGLTDGTKKTKTIKTTLKPGKCTSSSLSASAPSVSRDTTKTYSIEVNANKKNPVDENNWANNVAKKEFTVINDLVDGTISITKWEPTYPHSNQYVTITYKITNKGSSTAYGVKYKIGYDGKESTKTISKLAAGETQTLTVRAKTPKVSDYTGTKKIKATITAGFSGDINTSDNKDTETVTVRNPDAFTKVKVTNDSSDNTIGKVSVQTTNKTWNTITEQCSGSSCKSGTAKTQYVINVYDTKFTDNTSDDELVTSYNPTYSLSYNQSRTFNIEKSVFKNWVNSKYPDSYALVQFRVTAQIPEYVTEVDFDGQAKYENNFDEQVVNYFPPRPEMVTAECNILDHDSSTYFNLSDGVGPIKMCAGHFPTHPSTTVESGMEAYHYVLYRFFPQPMPKYSVKTPEADSTNPNHFSQLYTLPTSENNDVLGDFESMFIPKKLANSYYQERGRYMPTNGTFDFEVYKKKSDGTKGDIVALGTVSHNVSASCYNAQNLDIKHQYGCDEILFFLPNADTADKYAKPKEYGSSSISYPISDSRIPYLNPGEYTFEFNAEEEFRYYYQTNLSKTGYQWGNAKFQ